MLPRLYSAAAHFVCSENSFSLFHRLLSKNMLTGIAVASVEALTMGNATSRAARIPGSPYAASLAAELCLPRNKLMVCR